MSHCNLQVMTAAPFAALPAFDTFLKPIEAQIASATFESVGNILEQTTPPRAALFDIDATLYDDPARCLDGRMIGALYAFCHVGILNGIYSMRPRKGILSFLHQYPPVESTLARELSGSPFILDNDYYASHFDHILGSMVTVDKRDDVALATYPREGEPLLLDATDAKDGTSEFIKRPHLRIGRRNRWHLAPKFVPCEGTLLVDDKDYGNDYRRIMMMLARRKEHESSLYQAAVHSLEHFWHVEVAAAGRGFSKIQLQGLRNLLR